MIVIQRGLSLDTLTFLNIVIYIRSLISYPIF